MSTTDPKKMAIGDLFTEKELKRAFEIMEAHHVINACNDLPTMRSRRVGRDASVKTLNDILIEQVVLKALPRIDKLTGRENNAMYFAYVLQYAYAKTQGRES